MRYITRVNCVRIAKPVYLAGRRSANLATAWLFKQFKIELSLRKCSEKCSQFQIDLSRYRTQESQNNLLWRRMAKPVYLAGCRSANMATAWQSKHLRMKLSLRKCSEKCSQFQPYLSKSLTQKHRTQCSACPAHHCYIHLQTSCRVIWTIATAWQNIHKWLYRARKFCIKPLLVCSPPH